MDLNHITEGMAAMYSVGGPGPPPGTSRQEPPVPVLPQVTSGFVSDGHMLTLRLTVNGKELVWMCEISDALQFALGHQVLTQLKQREPELYASSKADLLPIAAAMGFDANV